MTVYFQGGEQDTFFNPVGGVDTSGQHDATWARISVTGNNTCRTGVAITDFWCMMSVGNYTTILANNHVWFTVYDLAGNARIRARGYANNAYYIEYWNGSAWVQSGVAGGAVWSTITQMVLHVSIATGTIEWWQNGTLMGSVTGLNLSSITDLSTLALQDPVGAWYYSQVVIADESLLLWNVKTAWPTANGADVDGTGDYTVVDENALSDTDYLTFTTAGQKRSYQVSSRAAITRYPKAVTAACRAMRLDDTGPQQIRPYVLIGGTRYYGTTVTLTTGWNVYQYTWRENPATSLAWTIADVTSATLEYGWEAVA